MSGANTERSEVFVNEKCFEYILSEEKCSI